MEHPSKVCKGGATILKVGVQNNTNNCTPTFLNVGVRASIKNETWNKLKLVRTTADQPSQFFGDSPEVWSCLSRCPKQRSDTEMSRFSVNGPVAGRRPNDLHTPRLRRKRARRTIQQYKTCTVASFALFYRPVRLLFWTRHRLHDCFVTVADALTLIRKRKV